MALTPEQVQELKEQLRQQVSSLPEDRKSQALAQIESLSPEALESMISQQQSENAPQEGPQKTIFRMIVDKDIKSTDVAETKDALAVLDINPISKGHIMIIPKKPAKDSKNIPSSAFSLAKKLATRLVEKLKAKSTDIQTEIKFGEAIIHILPSYDKPVHLGLPREKKTPEELEKIAEQIRIVKKPKIEKIKIKKEPAPSNVLKLNRKIP